MKALKYLILLPLLPALLLFSCNKEEDPSMHLTPDNVRVFPDSDIRRAIDAVAGDGVVLLTYLDIYNQYQFKLIDNFGNELWTKSFGFTYILQGTSSVADLNILYDSDKTFAVFYENSLLKINHIGDVVLNNPSFLNVLLNYDKHHIMLGNNDNFLIMGSVNISGNRAFVSEVNRNGQLNFTKLYTVNVTKTNAFTGSLPSKTGGYIIAGSFSSLQGLNSAFFVMELDKDGNVLTIQKNDIDTCYCSGSELIKMDNNLYGYLISPVDELSPDGRSRFYSINDTGAVLGVSFLDLAQNNFGTGIVKDKNGFLTGLMRTEEENYDQVFGIPPSYAKPHYGYSFTMNSNALVLSQDYLNKTYSNYFNSIVKMSNGQLLIFGTTLSFGEEMKLTIILK